MKIPANNKLSLALSTLLLAGSQIYMVHAADSDHSGIAAPPKFQPGASSYPPPPPGGWEGVVDSIDKQIEQDIKEIESGSQFGGTTGFPEFPDPPEWAQRGVPQPPEWTGSEMPAPPEWADRDTAAQPEWAQRKPGTSIHWGGDDVPKPAEWSSREFPEPPEWGDRGMPEPPEWTGRGMPQQPQWAQSGAGQPRQFSREIPDPPDWTRSGPGYPQARYDRGRGYPPAYRGRSTGAPGVRGPWDRGRRGRDRGFSPFGGSGPSFDAPWDSGRGGGRSMPWSSNKGRGGWMDKDWFSDSWDDMLNAPADMGDMPGGWSAPTISAPNPVDVGDELGRSAGDVPGQMRNVYDDNRRTNRYDDYDRYDRYDRDDRYRR